MARILEPDLRKLIEAHSTPLKVRGRIYEYNHIHHKSVCVGWETREGFYTLTHPLHVFKKVFCFRWSDTRAAIANLVIPAGAVIYVDTRAFLRGASPHTLKMRASEAFVHSIALINGETQLASAHSVRDNAFTYIPGRTVKPKYRFSKKKAQCESGIHFFVNLAAAKNY